MISAEAANVALRGPQARRLLQAGAPVGVGRQYRTLRRQPADRSDHGRRLLRRKELPDRVGGVGFITRLMEAVPSTSNVDFYVAIVDETSVRRRLLRAGGEVGSLAMR